MNYEIKVDQNTGKMYASILGQEGEIIRTCFGRYNDRKQVVMWVAFAMTIHNPDGPCHMTRKKVYNDRVIGRPGFWEVTTYNAKGEKLRSGQWSDILEEGFLRGLVQDRFGFPLEAAEEIE